jgi:hypothetical protein
MEVPLQDRLVVLSRELSGVSSGDGPAPVPSLLARISGLKTGSDRQYFSMRSLTAHRRFLIRHKVIDNRRITWLSRSAFRLIDFEPHHGLAGSFPYASTDFLAEE